MKRLLLTVVMCIVVSGAFVLPKTSHAEGGGWLTAELAGELDEDPDPYSSYGQCFPQEIHIAANNGPGFYAAQGCLFTAKSYSYTVHDGILYATHGDGDILYPLTNAGFGSYTQVTPSPETNDFIFGSIIIKDYPDTVPFVENGKTSYYDLQNDTIYNFLTNEQGSAQQDVMAGAVSRNGKWRVLYVSRVGIVRFNVEDKTALRVTDELDLAGSLAVSNDGRYVVAAPNSVNRPTIYDTEDCGEKATVLQSAWSGTALANVCPSRELIAEFDSVLGSTLSRASSPTFSADDKQLTLYGYKNNKTATVTLHASGYAVEPTRLEYLALGDSFSSGEGDIERDTVTGLKAYREHTDDDGTALVDGYTNKVRPKEKCHLSTNSYPYHLAVGMDLGEPTTKFDTTLWQSVACAGATAWDVKQQGSEDYEGQNDGNQPRLEGYDVANLKTQALNEFIPGRQKQIEFVKKYQPKVITLTMGGNDLNFGGKMRECVSWQDTCSYAELEWRGKLKNEILDQFSNLSSLYEEIKTATNGNSKIYVIGYPVYVNADPNAKCSSKQLFLNLEEREMIVSSIIYTNNIIKAAAEKAGVAYVDVEHAFDNHRLCDNGDSHVNAVAGLLGYRGNEEQESFHPNRAGHVDMARAVWDSVSGESLLDHVTCPNNPAQKVCPNRTRAASDAAVPPYFMNAKNDDTKVRYYTLTNGTLIKSTLHYQVNSDKLQFESRSKVDISLYSKPTYLGSFSTDNEGKLSASITIPEFIPAGYHRLVVTGSAADGSPVELYQTVYVKESEENALDEKFDDAKETEFDNRTLLSSSSADMSGLSYRKESAFADSGREGVVHEGAAFAGDIMNSRTANINSPNNAMQLRDTGIILFVVLLLSAGLFSAHALRKLKNR